MLKIVVISLVFMGIIISNNSLVAAEKIDLKVWLEQESLNEIVLEKEEIKSYNYLIQQLQVGDMPNLIEYPKYLNREEVVRYLSAAEMPREELYRRGELINAGWKANLELQRNIENLPATVMIKYAVTIRRSNLRTFPSDEAVYESKNDLEFDLFQETAIDPSEAVIVLWQSKDLNFYFVQTKNYRGWVNSRDLAIAKDKNDWLKYANPDKFLIVTEPLLKMMNLKEELLWQMGSKIILTKKPKGSEYEIILPKRDNQGFLQEQRKKIRLQGVNEGYIAYNRANIIKQAFKFQGEPYGWGGLHDSVDCSSFIENIYRTVGLQLPRNADQQETASASIVCLNNKSNADKVALIKGLPPATVLFKDGHTMLYLGEKGEKQYVIHALGSQGRYNAQGEIVRLPIMKVVVTDLDILMRTGKSLLETLTTAVDYR